MTLDFPNDVFTQAAQEYRADRARREGPGQSASARPRLAYDRGDSIGMDDMPSPPLSAYAGEYREATGPERATERRSAAFELVRAADMKFSAPEFLVHGLIETSSLALIFGDPGCGKSFLAIDLACSVATGRPFHGRETMRGPVIYLLGEGHGGIKRRVNAWERHTGQSLDGAPLFFSTVAARFLDVQHAAAVAEAADSIASTEGPPRLIVVDTLARSFAGGDENTSTDMGRFIAALDALKARYPGSTVLCVHHTGHAEKQRARGSMALKGALDCELRVQKDNETVTLAVTKMKDAPEPDPLAFTLKSVEIGRNRQGEAFTSAVLDLTDAPAKRRPKLSAANRLALDSFQRAKRLAGLADDLAAGVHIDAWRTEFYAASTADTADAKKVAFQRARKALVESGDLAVTNDVYRLARLPEGKT